MVRLRGGTGHKRGDVYGGNLPTRPDSASTPDANQSYRRKPKGATLLGALFPKLTKQIFENYGFSTAQLIADWPAIVGPELAKATLPEKLKWPKGTPTFLEEEGLDHGDLGKANLGKGYKQAPKGATLVLRVEGPRSIEVQFGAAQIMERINRYFGYKAVTELRIIQAPVPQQQEKPRKLPPPDVSDITKGLKQIKNQDLRDALYRMAQGVKSSNLKKN